MNTRQLLYLITCARTGSIAAAARELDIAQPSISQQLAALEHELKIRLLERDHKGVRLTAAGQRFLPVASTALQQLEGAKVALQESAADPFGRVVIGMTQPTGNALAIPLFADINRRYPGIELDLYTGLSSRLYEQLRKGEVDLLVCPEDASSHMGMVSEPLLTERLFLAVSTRADGDYAQLASRDSLRFSELANYQVMYTSEQDSLGFRVAQYEKLTGVRLQRQIPFGQLLTSMRYVAEGYGLMICSTTAAYPQVRQGEVKLLPVIEPDMTRQMNLVYLHEYKKNAAFLRVVEAIRQQCQQLVDDGTWVTTEARVSVKPCR